VLVREKIRQNEKQEEMIEDQQGGSSPSGRQKLTGRKHNAKSGRLQAIKESQQEQDKFINKSVVDDQ